MKQQEITAYEQEYQETLARLKKSMPPYREAKLLLQAIEKHFSFKAISSRRPKIIVLGSGIPDELVYAFGVRPYWVLGGSLQTGVWAGDAAPRDADPVSRSLLGRLLGLEDFAQNALILLPIVSDSTRKLAYLLRRSGMKVHTIDIPPVKDEFAVEKYTYQLELCAEALASHTGKRLSRRALQGSTEIIAQARAEARRFARLSSEKTGIISAPWRIAKNDALQEAAAAALSAGDIDGVVYCVLKGQIEYDFELERIEAQCSDRNIPVFRLETDYNQQDVEQLRIRMEAHSAAQRDWNRHCLFYP